jgi:hypothetical protein
MRLGIESPDMYYNRGVAWEHLGEHQKALADMERARCLLQAIELGEQQSSIQDPNAKGSNSDCQMRYWRRAGRHRLWWLSTLQRRR